LNDHSQLEPPCVTLRPNRELFRQGLIAITLGSILIFAVLYGLEIPAGYGAQVGALQAGLLLVTIVTAHQFLNVRIVLRADGTEERGFFGRRSRVLRNHVHSVLIVQIYEHHSADSLPHLFVSDIDGRLLLRMRGQYWAPGDIELVAAHLKSAVIRPDEPVSVSDFYAESPQLLYWFERAVKFSRAISPTPPDDLEIKDEEAG